MRHRNRDGHRCRVDGSGRKNIIATQKRGRPCRLSEKLNHRFLAIGYAVACLGPCRGQAPARVRLQHGKCAVETSVRAVVIIQRREDHRDIAVPQCYEVPCRHLSCFMIVGSDTRQARGWIIVPDRYGGHVLALDQRECLFAVVEPDQAICATRRIRVQGCNYASPQGS